MRIRRGDSGRRRPTGLPDGALWQRSRTLDVAADEAARYLDLAAFADGRLDPDDRERVAEWLAGDPHAAADVAAARAFAAMPPSEPLPEAMAARACALLAGGPDAAGNVLRFPQPRRAAPRLRGVAGWGSLVAAMAVASWLGFTLGMDTSYSYMPVAQADESGFLHDLLNPSAGIMRNLTEGSRT